MINKYDLKVGDFLKHKLGNHLIKVDRINKYGDVFCEFNDLNDLGKELLTINLSNIDAFKVV